MKMPVKSLVATLFVLMLPTNSLAGQLQVQFMGTLPDGEFTVAYRYQKVLVDGCASPCDVGNWKKATVRRHSSGKGLLNLNAPDEATRVCFGADRRFKFLETIVYELEPKKKKWTARRGSNANVDPAGGNSCGDHRADIGRAKVMTVEVD